jgi:cyclopropane-fatty-acyl-phospholipid synthase
MPAPASMPKAPRRPEAAMARVLQKLLASFIRIGTLQVITAGGHSFTLGDGTGNPVTLRFLTRRAELGLILDPELSLGESYMDGSIVIEDGSIADLLALAMRQDTKPPTWARPLWLLRYFWRRLKQRNVRGRARRNVAHHYDLDSRLYAHFLDADRQYSCAYYESPDASLDDAQLAKKRHLAAKLLIKPGHRLLDIGSGWGGLGLYLAELYEAQVVGVTLSEEQLHLARARAAERGLSERAEFRLEDYRDIPGPFDRIVSVGMFEHVGVGFYDAFFGKCASILKDDGVMLLHSIGRSEGPSFTNPWIDKYIFPGGYIPALSEVLPAIERSGLLITDIEILRLHYAETLKAWREHFLARREEIERFYDARFCRMWEFYLAASEMSFRHQAMMVMQIQLTKRQDVVPMTRDYIGREEARLRALEGGARAPLRLAGE